MKKMFLSIKEVAELTSLSVSKIRKMIRSGELAAYHAGRRILVPVEALEQSIAGGGEQ